MTTILSRFKESGALMFWAFTQGQLGKSSLYEASGVACDIGTLAHSAVEAHIKGEDHIAVLETAPDDNIYAGALNSYEQFCEWEQQTKVQWHALEIPLVSEEFRFGGCPDAIGEINGKRVLIDFKTSAAIHSDYACQLAAYQHLWNCNHSDEQLSDTSYICRFSKTDPDFTVMKLGDLSDAWELFKLYRRAYDLDKKLKARIK